LALVCAITCSGAALLLSQASAAPVIVVETSKGMFAFETFPDDAPKAVKHIVDLVKRGFYDGQRFHRAIAGFAIQWGDPQSRDAAKEAAWGRGRGASSGSPIGVAEIAKKRTHAKGAVALAHQGNPAQADSQLYVMLGRHDELNGRYAVVGRVVAGMDVADQIEKGDLIERMYVKE
jgi:cyclophilin family peptidyl-prolyl cis-trans isomerase